jgi:hypothetical protein
MSDWVQHYGYCFDYSQRGVDAQQQIRPMLQWVQPLVQQMEVGACCSANCDLLL